MYILRYIVSMKNKNTQKVYQYNQKKVQKKLVTAIKKRKNESTIADLIAVTGLPKHQVEETMPKVVLEYAGQMKVTESGEILYYFPRGMKNIVQGPLPKFKRNFSNVVNQTGKALTLLFKVWIMVTLIGYFVIFVTLLLLALFASMAASASSKDSRTTTRSRGGGFMGFYLTSQIFRIFISLLLYSRIEKSSRQNAWALPKKRKKDPLHYSIFAFVFGTDKKEQREWSERLRKAFITYVMNHQSIITIEELMNLSGFDFSEANRLMSAYLLEYNGEPDVSEGGTLIYRFPELLRTKNLSKLESEFYREKKPLISFNKNKASANRWIGFFNGFNLVFGTYFMVASSMNLANQTDPLSRFYLIVQSLLANVFADPSGIILVVLGIIPFIFSIFFYLIPFLRRMSEKGENKKIKTENFRKHINNRIWDNPDHVNPEAIEPSGEEEALQNYSAFRRRYVEAYAAEKEGEPVEKGKDTFIYRFPEILREQDDLIKVRKSVDMTQYDVGGIVFDSGSEKDAT